MYDLIWHIYKMKFQSLPHCLLHIFQLFVIEIKRTLKCCFIKCSRIIRLGINMNARLWKTSLVLSFLRLTDGEALLSKLPIAYN